MHQIIIDSEQQKTYAKNLIDKMPADGSCLVITKKVDKTSSAKQRGLKWIWNDEIAKSGLGRDDTDLDVHIRMKMKFGHGIKMRAAQEDDEDCYPEIYTAVTETYKNHPAYSVIMKNFANEHIKTEKFTQAQNAEYLTKVQQYWSRKGVNLTDPDNYGKNLLRFKPQNVGMDC